jgi:hypothetical protein
VTSDRRAYPKRACPTLDAYTVPEGKPVIAWIDLTHRRQDIPGPAVARSKEFCSPCYVYLMANTLKIVACLLWAGVGISAATPANALMETTVGGKKSYGIVGGNWAAQVDENCNGVFNYLQDIRFPNIRCNSGQCMEAWLTPTARVDNLYVWGRLELTLLQSCLPDRWLMEIGSCPC